MVMSNERRSHSPRNGTALPILLQGFCMYLFLIFTAMKWGHGISCFVEINVRFPFVIPSRSHTASKDNFSQVLKMPTLTPSCQIYSSWVLDLGKWSVIWDTKCHVMLCKFFHSVGNFMLSPWKRPYSPNLGLKFKLAGFHSSSSLLTVPAGVLQWTAGG